VNPHKLTLRIACFCLIFSVTNTHAQKQKPPLGGRIAVVVDERLSAVRATPELTGKLVRRLSRGRLVAIRTAKTDRDGVVFYFVNLSSRTHGWIQREAVVSAQYRNDDERLLTLLKNSTEFDRVARARIFLDTFPRSALRAEVLLILGDAAEQVSAKLSREAEKRADKDAQFEHTYFLNYSGLDRYNRQGVTFTFDPSEHRLHYDGAAWREIVRRFPRSPEAVEAKKRLDSRFFGNAKD